mgnify:CR=1 FL=1
MTSSINTGDIHDNPHFSSQEMGIFLYSSHTNFENNEALVRPHGASSPPTRTQLRKRPIFRRFLPAFS